MTEKHEIRHYLPPLELHLDRVRTRSELREAITTSKRSCEGEFDAYLAMLCRGGHAGVHGIQYLGQKGWDWKVKKPYLGKIAGHLRGNYYIGLLAPYFPVYAVIDVDSPRGSTRDTITEIAQKLELDESQYAVFTSPSFWKSRESHAGSFHVCTRPTYDDNPASLKIHEWRLGPIVDELGFERFPRTRKLLRLPFGRDQHYIEHSGRFEFDLSWQERLRILKRLVPVDLKKYPFQVQEVPIAGCRLDRIDTSPQKKEAEELIRTGLVRRNTRHDMTGLLARWCYFRNTTPERAKEFILDFLRRKHNGMSDEIENDNWKLVEKETETWVDKTYECFAARNVFPDNVHNLIGWATRDDIKLISQALHGDYINQRRLFKFVSYCRPRWGDREYIPIHRDRFRKIAGRERKSDFRRLMEEKKLIDFKDSYRVGAYSKSYRMMCLSPASSDDAIKDQDERAVLDYKQALWHVFKNASDIVDATGAPRRSIYK